MKLQNNFFKIFSSVLLIFSALALSNCTKSSINGDLDGKWQILEIETDGVSHSIKDEQLYYNFYMHVCNLSYYSGVLTDGNMRFENNSLWLQFPYLTTQEGMLKLHRYGIFSNPVTFSVVHLSKSKLILKEGDIIITLSKF